MPHSVTKVPLKVKLKPKKLSVFEHLIDKVMILNKTAIDFFLFHAVYVS